MKPTPSKQKTRPKPVKTYRVTSLDKALSILELVINRGRDLSITEISQELSMMKGTVHRLLNTLWLENSFSRTARQKCTALACGRWK